MKIKRSWKKMLRNLNRKNEYFLQNTFQPEQRFYNMIRKNSKSMPLWAKKKGALRSLVRKNLQTVSSEAWTNCMKEVRKSITTTGTTDDTVNVRKEWKTCDLLVYTPSITCGVNFPRVTQWFDPQREIPIWEYWQILLFTE